MVDFLKKNAMLSIILSVLFLILGIIVVMNPEVVMKLMAYTVGIAFVIVGIVKLITYFSNKSSVGSHEYEFLLAIVALAVGIFSITCGDTISAFFRIVIGIWITYMGVIRFIGSVQLKNVGISFWPFLLIMSILMVIAGIYVVANSGTLIVSLGVIMIIYSIMDLIEGISFYSNISKLA